MRTETRCYAAPPPLVLALLLACAALGLAETVTAQDGIYGYTDVHGTLHLSDVADDARYELLVRDPDRQGVKAPPQAAHNSRSAAAVLDAQPYHAEIVAAAGSHGVDAALIHAVIKAESAYNPAAVSRKGALGLMQLMPDTARRYGVRDARDPRQNIDGGTRYLNDLIRRFSGDLPLVLAAYNAGEDTVVRYGNRIPPYAETLQYVPRVLRLYRLYTVPDLMNPRAQRKALANKTAPLL